LTILISALPVEGKSLTVQKSDRVTLQIEQDINDIKETKWFMHDIDASLIRIQPDNKRYNGGTHDNPSLTICRVDFTINYVCIVRHKDDKIESFKWRLRVISQGMCLYIITEIYLM
jgi:hypothetical protein